MERNANPYLAGVLQGYRQVLGDAIPPRPEIPAAGDGRDRDRVHQMLCTIVRQVVRFPDRAAVWGDVRRGLPDAKDRDNADRIYRVAGTLERAAMAARKEFDDKYGTASLASDLRARRMRLSTQVGLAITLKILARATREFESVPDPVKTGEHFGESAAYVKLDFDLTWATLVEGRPVA